MNIESLILCSLQINLLGKKLKYNNSLIVNVGISDIGDYEYDWRVYVATDDGQTFDYVLSDDIDLVED